MKNLTMKLAVLIVIFIIVIGCGFFIYKKKTTKQLEPLPKFVNIEASNQPLLGSEKAPIHMVIFEDLKCVNCKYFATKLLPKIKEKYINTGAANARLVTLAFIPGSIPAGNAAYCLYDQNPNYFFEFVDYVYQHQPPENEDWATIPTLMDFANHISGVDQHKFGQCLVSSPYNNRLLDNLKLAITVMNGQVLTPSLYINGIRVAPMSEQQIDRILKEIKNNPGLQQTTS